MPSRRSGKAPHSLGKLISHVCSVIPPPTDTAAHFTIPLSFDWFHHGNMKLTILYKASCLHHFKFGFSFRCAEVKKKIFKNCQFFLFCPVNQESWNKWFMFRLLWDIILPEKRICQKKKKTKCLILNLWRTTTDDDGLMPIAIGCLSDSYDRKIN